MTLCDKCGFTLDGPLHRDYCPKYVGFLNKCKCDVSLGIWNHKLVMVRGRQYIQCEHGGT
jgi:hypothetical protein